MNKKTVLALIFLILCFGTAFVQYKRSIPQNIKTHDFVFTITQKVAGKQKREQIKVGSTALELLSTTHKIVTKGEKQNAFVTTIDGYIADPNKKEFWAFYVNGKQAEVGAGTYIVKNNDTIEWKIETY
jgi:hypothetical protein